MASPLTWQNVDGPRAGYGGPSFSDALQAINTGLNSLQGVGKSLRDASVANFDNAKNQNTGALVNALSNITDAGELQKQIASGAFNADNLQKQFGGAIDYGVFNKALQERAGQIQADQEGQLKLNEDTDYQAHQADLAQLAGLANTDPSAYNAALKNLDLGTAAGRILSQTNPYMSATRENATTMRGQDLSHADNQAQIGLARDQFNYRKAQDTRLQAQKDTDDAFASGQNFAVSALKDKSENDATKEFINSKAFLAMDPDHQKAALSGLSTAYQRGSAMTDAEQQDFQKTMQPVQQIASAIDNKISTLTANFARTNPQFQILQGADELSGKSQQDVVKEMMEGTKYNDAGEVTDKVNAIAQKYNVPPALVASVAKNSQKSSAIRLGGFGREGVTYDWDRLDDGVAAAIKYQSSGQAYQDQQTLGAVTMPAAQLKQQISQVQQTLKRVQAAGGDTTAIKRNLETLQKQGATVYGALSKTADDVQASANNTIPANASKSFTQGVLDNYRR